MRQLIPLSFLFLFFACTHDLGQHLVPTQKQGKWGLVDSTEKILIPFEHDRVRHLADGVYAGWQGDEVRLYGHRLRKKVFRDAGLLKDTEHTLVLANEKGDYGMVTTKGKKVLPFQFCAPPRALEDKLLFAVRNGPRIDFGLYTSEGKNIIPPQYYSIQKWGDNFYKAQTQAGAEVLIGLDGEVLIEVKGEVIDWVVGGFVVLRQGEENRKVFVRANNKVFALENLEYRSGFMIGNDHSGAFCILTPEGELIHLKNNQKLLRIEDGKMLICQLGLDKNCKKETLLDLKLHVLIPPQYDHIIDWDGQRAVLQPDRRKERYSLYQMGEKSGFLLENKERIQLYDHGWLRIYEDGEWKFLNASIEPQELSYPEIEQLPEKYVAIPLRYIRRLRAQNSSFFDPETHNQIASDRTFPLEVNDARNLRDKYNNEQLPDRVVIRAPYQNAGPRTLLMDLYGKVQSVMSYNTISYYEEGLITVYGHDTIDGVQKSVMGLLDLDGKLQIPLTYDKIESIGPDHVVVQKYGLYGVVSRRNETILPIKYGYVRYDSGYFLVRRFGKWGVIGREGKEIVPIRYDEIKLLEGGVGFEGKRGKEKVLLDLGGRLVGG